ncbi:MAG: PD-(D/E)XK nuclease family protein [Phycisphaeraceae bacterium]
MGIERHFLGWDGPALHAAARWLRERHPPRGGVWELGSLTIVLPGAEAGRRLLELLVREAGAALIPPRMVTPGELPELLYRPTTPVAGALQTMLARVSALRSAKRAVLETVVPHPPEPNQWGPWWSLARQLDQLSEDLAAGSLQVADVLPRSQSEGVQLTELAEQRWAALAELEQGYQSVLEQLGLCDRHAARRDAIAQQRCTFDGELVLLAVVDVSRALADMLDQLDAPATALVHAPADHAAGFDAHGSLRTDYWQHRHVDLADADLHIADRPNDQARELVRLLTERSGQRYTVDQITVGLGDERQAGVVRRGLELAGVPTRYAAGKPLAQSRPAMLLASLGRLVGQRRFDDLAELLRHPDVEQYVSHHLRDAPTHDGDDGSDGDGRGATPGRAAIEHWLALLDRYAADHLQGRVDGRWLGSADRQRRLHALWQAVAGLLDVNANDRRPLPEWSEPIAGALRAVYGALELTRHERHDELLIRSLQSLAQALREQADVEPDSPITPTLTAAEAIALTLSRVETVGLPEPGGAPAVELMGYLQLQLDDAPMLAITSMNEGAVPGAQVGDAFLPNTLRSAMGLTDNARRFARDAFALHAIVRSRPDVLLLACRRSMEGEPLAPSRLLLACDEATMVQRVRSFYDEQPGDAVAAPGLLLPGERDRFLIPHPPLLGAPVLDRLRVTAFRDYLACPYRFYLRHVLKLRGVEDGLMEMDSAAFGTLAHDVLAAFGQSDLAHCDDDDEIRNYLSSALDDRARRRFGQSQRPAIRVQVEQLRERLGAFARHQAELVRDGWRIVIDHVEVDLQAELTIDGEPFTVTGKIDRIDHREADGAYRIIDYKTGDGAKRPDQTHCRNVQGGRTWIDLQLPLYLDLARPLGVTGRVELGYMNLPKKLAEVKLSLADWDDDALAEARATRDAVVGQLRDCCYWPPSDDPPTFSDEFAAVCADAAIDRRTLIAQSTNGDAPST